MLKSHRNIDSHNEPSGRGFRKLHRALLLGALSVFSAAATAAETPARVQAVVTPAPVVDVALIHPFTLRDGFAYDWRQERPLIKNGLIVVLKVNPDLVLPRDAAEPILYAGTTTAQRLNQGDASGYVIALVPEELNLAQQPLWFGSAGLPEWANATTIRAERAKADGAGIRPFEASRVQGVTKERLQANDLAALLRDRVADVLLTYSPQERALAETWRLPVAQR